MSGSKDCSRPCSRKRFTSLPLQEQTSLLSNALPVFSIDGPYLGSPHTRRECLNDSLYGFSKRKFALRLDAALRPAIVVSPGRNLAIIWAKVLGLFFFIIKYSMCYRQFEMSIRRQIIHRGVKAHIIALLASYLFVRHQRFLHEHSYTSQLYKSDHGLLKRRNAKTSTPEI